MNQTPAYSAEAQAVFALLTILSDPAATKKRLEELEKIRREAAEARAAANVAQNKAAVDLAVAVKSLEQASKELRAAQATAAANATTTAGLQERQKLFDAYEREGRAKLEQQQQQQTALTDQLETERRALVTDRARLDKLLAENAAAAADLTARKQRLEKALA